MTAGGAGRRSRPVVPSCTRSCSKFWPLQQHRTDRRQALLLVVPGAASRDRLRSCRLPARPFRECRRSRSAPRVALLQAGRAWRPSLPRRSRPLLYRRPARSARAGTELADLAEGDWQIFSMAAVAARYQPSVGEAMDESSRVRAVSTIQLKTVSSDVSMLFSGPREHIRCLHIAEGRPTLRVPQRHSDLHCDPGPEPEYRRHGDLQHRGAQDSRVQGFNNRRAGQSVCGDAATHRMRDQYPLADQRLCLFRCQQSIQIVLEFDEVVNMAFQPRVRPGGWKGPDRASRE